MEAKGIRTDKGDFNRWVRKTNAMLREAKNKITSLLKWLKAVKEELSKPQPPMLNDLLMTYYNNRNNGAYSTKAKTANLQRYADAFRFLQECEAYWNRRSPFCKTVERKIGNTWYTIETVCDGTEPLTAKVKRLIFSDREVAC